MTITIPRLDTPAKVQELLALANWPEELTGQGCVVDMMEEMVKFTLLTREVSPYLADRYSERKESAAALSKRVNQRSV